MDELEAIVDSWRRLSGRTFHVPGNPFPLRCSIDDAATSAEIEAAWPHGSLPAAISKFWQNARSARLYEDIEYGQWGMVILSPLESARRTRYERRTRSEDIRDDDIVFAEFLGDSDLVLVHASSGCVIIAGGIDRRRDWPSAASSVIEFLSKYTSAQGMKYWEPGGAAAE
jgi:hypothetical protein